MCLMTAAYAPVVAVMCCPVVYAVRSAECRLKFYKVCMFQPSGSAMFVQVPDAVDCLFIVQLSKAPPTPHT